MSHSECLECQAFEGSRQATERCITVVRFVGEMLVRGPKEVEALQQALELNAVVVGWWHILSVCSK